METVLQSCGLADCVASSYGGRNRKCAAEYAHWLLSEEREQEPELIPLGEGNLDLIPDFLQKKENKGEKYGEKYGEKEGEKEGDLISDKSSVMAHNSNSDLSSDLSNGNNDSSNCDTSSEEVKESSEEMKDSSEEVKDCMGEGMEHGGQRESGQSGSERESKNVVGVDKVRSFLLVPFLLTQFFFFLLLLFLFFFRSILLTLSLFTSFLFIYFSSIFLF